jgi:hypothetical protein
MANQPSTNTHSFRPMTDRQKEQVVTDILDSMIANPTQTRDFRASETARIAKRRRVTNLQVAAIRANLTRGAYGAVRTLVNRRKREQRASA